MNTAITFNTEHARHAQDGHVERPERLEAIKELLEQDGLLENVQLIESRIATEADVQLVHPVSYFQKLQTATEAGFSWLDPDTYATPSSLEVALKALGNLLSITEAVASGNVHNGFAIVRPPGHHARPNEAMGFCLLANISIAARWVQRHMGVERVAIVDFDVHHGNGTQEIFYDDPDVLYISTHQFPLYPGTGALNELGTGAGTGTTINIPLPVQAGDKEIQQVFKEILRTRVLNFKPEIILVSAGYDAHWQDPLGGLNMTVDGFSMVMKELLEWAAICSSNRLVALLEGGYHADALAQSVLSTVRLLIHAEDHFPDPIGTNPWQQPVNGWEGYMKKFTEVHYSG